MAMKNKIVVKVYLNAENFPRMAAIAERMGKRRGGLLLFTQKPHGRADELLANTDGLSRAMKASMLYWEADEAGRLAKKAAAMKELEAARARARAEGLEVG